ncbi:MAG: hypothetical protein R3B06_06025 [Kofleriaceae bacterium]
MAITSLSFATPLRRLPAPRRLDYGLLEAAMAHAEAGATGDAVAGVLGHLFPDAPVPDLTAGPFAFVQGSSRVTVALDGDALAVTVPLVTLAGARNPVAALRYILTTVAGSGQLYQPRLRGDDITLEFRDKLSRMHPAKLLEVLRQMPVEADRVDDWLETEFGARPLERAPITPLDDAEAAAADALWRSHWADVEELVKESQRRRSVFFLNEVTALALFRVQFALPVCGVLAAQLTESAGTWNDGQQDPTKREASLARCARDMAALPAATLRANLGHAAYALAPLAPGEAATLTSYFGGGDYLSAIDKYRTSGRSFEATLALWSSTTYLLARYAWPPETAAALMGALAAASGKPWREASAVLWDKLRAVAELFGADAADGVGPDDDDDDDDDDGDDDDRRAEDDR